MNYNAHILADSICNEQRIVTLEATFPRWILAEFNTHRMLSRNSASSRAIPPEKLIPMVQDTPFVPDFNERVKGMGVGKPLSTLDQMECQNQWLQSRNQAVKSAEAILKRGADKSRINRLLEPFMWHSCIITATDLSNFFALRDHEDAQPEMQKIARLMKDEIEHSRPIALYEDEWHLPLIDYGSEFAEAKATGNWSYWASISAGRCARWSYLTQHDNESLERTAVRYNSLIESGHMSPFEHQAYPFTQEERYYMKHIAGLIVNIPNHYVKREQQELWTRGLEYSGNFRLWHQFRKDLANEDDFSKVKNG